VELELDVPSIHGKLVEYIVHSTRRKKWGAIIYLHTSNLNREQPIFCFKET
jgi:molybdopterin-guanine dinucleotide biosynthesis protein A